VSTPALFLIMFCCFCLLMLLCIPWATRSSSQAQRMFAVVVSAREDKRKVGIAERILIRIAGTTHQLRYRLGRGSDGKMLKRFKEAGLHGAYVADLFLCGQIFGAISGSVLGSFAGSSPFFWVLAGGATGFMAPDFWLTAQQLQRRKRLQRSVPDMVDLLVICVGAGLGLDQALLRVTEELRLSHPDLSEELTRVLLERNVGASRIDAWRALAERTRLEEITSFVSMLAETVRFGSPITAALGQFSDELRTRRRQRAEEAAAKTKVKIIFPLVFCIFPCIFLVLLVPAMLGFLHSFSSIGR
jgi:tight adherence protein C